MLTDLERKELAELLFPNVKDTEEYIKQYPKRNLPEGAEVTRFAPSPTGFVHMGGIYTTLISRKLAHQTNGVFILRIEDTDKTREINKGVEQIIESLNRYGLIPDEGISPNGEVKGEYGPYMQSQRLDIYKSFAKKLVLEGKAYPCFMSSDELEALRKEQEKMGVRIGYYGQYAKWRDAGMEDIKKALEEGKEFVIRLRSNGDFNKKFNFKDLIKGSVTFPENDFDSVLLKSDGYPVYHFAHPIDDHFMGTTTVTRGDEWLSSIPLHKELFEILGWDMPKYAHISPLMKIDEETRTKRKLSKRKDPEANASFYIEKGYPIKGIMEYLLNIANSNFYDWRIQNPDKDINDFVLKLDKIHKSGALFDFVKFENVCKDVLAKYSAEEVYNEALEWSREFNKEVFEKLSSNKEYCISSFNIERGSGKIRKDISKMEDIREQLEIFFDDAFNNLEYPELKEGYKDILKRYLGTFNINDDVNTWFEKIKSIAQDFNYAVDRKEYESNPDKYNGNVGDVAMIIRIAVTKKTKTPDLYQIIQVLGEDRVRERIEECINR
jgi:glutamyl-tRNA synthetase